MAIDLEARLTAAGPKRILSLDGGGVRGLIACGVLTRMEEILRARQPPDRQADFRLCHYFDLIGGTSTGAIIAAWLALGHTAEETRQLYLELAPQVFGKTPRLASHFFVDEKFDENEFRKIIRSKIQSVARARYGQSQNLRFDDPLIQTGLAIFTKRIDRASPWIIHNHPHQMFWDPDSKEWAGVDRGRFVANRTFDLGTVIQASASAPTYLGPITLQIAPDEVGTFIDGGVSPNNNPAWQLFSMATLRNLKAASGMAASPYGYGWSTGEDKLLLVSIGTGTWRKTEAKGVNAYKAAMALSTMIDDASAQAVFNLQALSRPARPRHLNLLLGNMQDLQTVKEPLLTFARMDITLDAPGLREVLGGGQYKTMTDDFPRAGEEGLLKSLRKLDNADKTNLERLDTLGLALGAGWFPDDKTALQIMPGSFDHIYH